MFSRVIGFFDNLFWLYKALLVIASITFLAYTAYAYAGVEAQIRDSSTIFLLLLRLLG